MFLAYLDESGKSHEQERGFFKDGSHIIMVAILISELKYFHVERLFYELLNKQLGLKNWRKKEVHASDIWNGEGEFASFSKEKAREYFEELFQLIGKFNLPIVIGLEKKNPRLRTAGSRQKQHKNAVFCLLSALEHKLAGLDSTAILIADESEISVDMQDMLYKRTHWRYNPGERSVSKLGTRYLFETKSCFIVDQIHYVKSKDSFFIQLVDQIGFVLQRVFTHSFLDFHPEIKIADINKVPVTPNTFFIFAKDVVSGHFAEDGKDIVLTPWNDFVLGTNNQEFLSPNYIKSL